MPIARALAMDPTAAEHVEKTPPGERPAEAAAQIGGSWIFVAAALGFLAAGILVDVLVLLQSGIRPFDPRPYLFLNLILLSLAAIQAPLIMMSLNRQAQEDRIRAERDYEMNLKVELEIMGLHEKIESMRNRELADILAHQVELLQELRDRPRSTAA